MKKLLSLLLMLSMSMLMWAGNVTFDFNNGLSDLGLSTPNTGQGINLEEPVTYQGVTMDFTNGGTATRIWNSAGTTTLRVYKNGGSLTFTADVNFTSIVFDGTVNGTFDVGTWTSSTKTWTGSANSVTFTNGSSNSTINSITFTLDDGSEPPIVVTPPTFNPAAGEVEAGTEVTISAPDAEMILYTVDGTDPSVDDDNGEIYTEPIIVNETMTIKAIALDEDWNESAVATAIYTVVQPTILATIDEIVDLNDNDSFTFEGNAVVTYVNGLYTFIKDTSGQIVLYQSDLGLAQGDVVTSFKGVKTTYKGLYEVKTVSDIVKASETETVEPVELTTSDIAAENQSIYCVLTNVTITTISGKNITFDDNTKGYNQFNITLPAPGTYTIIGVMGIYNTAQFWPIEFKDVVEPEPTEVSTIAELKALDYNTEFTFTGEDLICIWQFGKRLYVQDPTGGMLLFDNSSSFCGVSYGPGELIPAGWKGKFVLYNGLSEVTNITDLQEPENWQSATPTEPNLGTLPNDELTNMFVIIKNAILIFDKATTTDNFYVMTDDGEILAYTGQLNNAEHPLQIPDNVDDMFDVIGIYVQYKSKDDNGNYTVVTDEILPMAFVDIETGVITEIEDVSINDVKSVTYYNALGVASNKPFDGINIIRIEYTNGKQSIQKVVK